MSSILEWVDPKHMIEFADLGLDLDQVEEHPDELALSLITAAGELLRALSDRRPDRRDLNQVIGNMLDSQAAGDDVTPLQLSEEVIASHIYETDSANRYVRMLLHSLLNTLRFTAEGGIGKLQVEDMNAGGREELDAVSDLFIDAAAEASKLLSPFGVLMISLYGAVHAARNGGLTPFQIINAMNMVAQGLLDDAHPVSPRLPEGQELPLPGLAISREDVTSHLPDIEGTWRFLESMKWSFKRSEPDAHTGPCPFVAMTYAQGIIVPVLSVGYSPLDAESAFARTARKANSYEFNLRNQDVLAISTRPERVERNGVSYSVIGEVFVRREGQNERSWRPAVAWPGCKTVEALLDLASSPVFDFNEVEFADPEHKVLNRLKEALAGPSKRKRAR